MHAAPASYVALAAEQHYVYHGEGRAAVCRLTRHVISEPELAEPQAVVTPPAAEEAHSGAGGLHMAELGAALNQVGDLTRRFFESTFFWLPQQHAAPPAVAVAVPAGGEEK